MEKLEIELGALRARLENLHLDMVELREDVKLLKEQVSMGRGAVRFIGIIGTVIVALTTLAAWMSQNFRTLSN